MTIETADQERIRQLRRLWKEAFGDSDDYLDRFFATAFCPERYRCITEEGRVVSALYWFDCSCRGQRMAYIYAVATAGDSRGRGLCRRLMEDTHAHLKSKGYAGTVLVPADEALRRMYGRMGYLPAAGVAEFTCRPAGEPEALRSLTAEEYARCRRELLSPGAVLQEGPLMDLLQTQCLLLAGEKLLLAAWVEDGVLHTEEFLGERKAAPGVLKTLGAREGVFRIPGEEKHFALYLPLTDRCPKPDYFGIALG